MSDPNQPTLPPSLPPSADMPEVVVTLTFAADPEMAVDPEWQDRAKQMCAAIGGVAGSVEIAVTYPGEESGELDQRLGMSINELLGLPTENEYSDDILQRARNIFDREGIANLSWVGAKQKLKNSGIWALRA